MENIILNVNDKITVIRDDKEYKSLIVDYDNQNMKINIPVNDGKYLVLYEGETIEINMHLDSGKCYEYNCTIVSKGKENNIVYYKLSLPYNVKRIQRRDFVRVKLFDEIEYKSAHDEIEEYKKAVMVDLSGGGVKIKVKDYFNQQDKIVLKITLNGVKTIIKGEIVRVENDEICGYVCGVKFIDITQRASDKIIKELFEIMRRQRAKL